MNLEIQFYLRAWKEAVGNTLNIRYDFVTNGGRSCLLDCTMRGQVVGASGCTCLSCWPSRLPRKR